MEFVRSFGSLRRISTDFVERHERHVDVKRRVFDSFGQQRACNLLKPSDEHSAVAATGFVEVGGLFQQQHVANEVE